MHVECLVASQKAAIPILMGWKQWILKKSVFLSVTLPDVLLLVKWHVVGVIDILSTGL